MNCIRKPVYAMFALAVGFGIAAPAARAQAPSGKKASEQFKNIQVLKDIPADQLLPTMQFFAASLGVGCDFCHVEPRDKDEKPEKATARKMLQMVMTANKETFAGATEVTCYTCHRGSARPISTPLVAGQEPPKPNAPRPAKLENLPSADQLFDKYLAAIGGKAAVEKLSSFVIKGSVMNDARGQQIPMEIYEKAHSMRLAVVHAQNGDTVTTFKGNTGWTRNGTGPARDINGAALDSARLEDLLYVIAEPKQVFGDMNVEERPETIGDRQAYVVTTKTQSLPRVRLYFDMDSGLLLRLTDYTETAVGRLPVQIDYEDYRDVGGLKLPYHWTISQARTRAVYLVDQFQANAPVEEAKFAKPSAAPAERRD